MSLASLPPRPIALLQVFSAKSGVQPTNGACDVAASLVFGNEASGSTGTSTTGCSSLPLLFLSLPFPSALAELFSPASSCCPIAEPLAERCGELLTLPCQRLLAVS